MYLKVYANHMKGVQVTETINLQCNSPSQIHSGVYVLQAENSTYDRWIGPYLHGRSAETNLAEIHEEMSELLNKQVNVQKESLKKFHGFTQSSYKPTKKCAMKMKETKEKNNYCVKIFVVKGSIYNAVSEDWPNRFQ